MTNKLARPLVLDLVKTVACVLSTGWASKHANVHQATLEIIVS